MVGQSSVSTVSYTLDTTKFKSEQAVLTLMVTVSVDGVVRDMFTSSSSLILDGFLMNSVQGGQISEGIDANWKVSIPDSMVG